MVVFMLVDQLMPAASCQQVHWHKPAGARRAADEECCRACPGGHSFPYWLAGAIHVRTGRCLSGAEERSKFSREQAARSGSEKRETIIALLWLPGANCACHSFHGEIEWQLLA